MPIRGGKLKASKPFSSSNPQLPFTCGSFSNYLSHNNNSSNSINSSHIWREATPNNFNLYSASISSLNTSYRSHNSMDCYGAARMVNWRSRAASEERPATGQLPPVNYDNASSKAGGTPLLARRAKQVKMIKAKEPSLYDRKLNRSFEKSDSGAAILTQNAKGNSPLRRSTPHLAAGEEYLFEDTFRASIAPTLCCASFMRQLRKMNQY